MTTGLAVLAGIASSFGATYDLSRDFSPTNNPNGVWTFGAKASFDGPLSVFGVRGLNPFEYWQLVPGQEPTIYRNSTTNTVTSGGSLTLPPGTVWYYGGFNSSSNQYGAIRFTVPAGGGGDYFLETEVRPVYDGAPQGDTDFHVVKNGGELFGRFLAPADRSGYTNTLSLAAGDTIDFLIGRGEDNNNYGSGLKTRIVISSLPPPPSVGAYSLADDFSPTNNPTGVWSYGAKPSLSGSFSLFGVRGLNPFEYWQLVPSQEPTIYRNGTPNTITIAGGQGVFPPKTVFFYSGTDGAANGFGAIRFTAPAGASGQYLVQAAVAPVYDGGIQGDTDFHVVKNGAELFGRFLAPQDRASYATSLALTAGDTLDFMVGRGQDNSGTSSGLKISVTIMPTDAPPVAGLVANGSFELGTDPGISADVSAPDSTTITGWTIETASVDYIGTRWIAGDGVRCLDLSGTDAGTISQMISGLTPGQHYRLSFLMAANPEVGAITARLRASIGGASEEFSFVQSGFSTANLGWTEKTLDFMASGSSHKLAFTSLNPGWAGAALDNVFIEAVTNIPPPSGLVANGSFELGTDPGVSADVPAPNATTITGWTIETASVDYIGTRWVAGDGVRCLDLSGTDAATISQVISGLTPGQHYRLSFLMAANPEVGSFTARLRASIGTASQEFSFLQSGFSTVNLGWTEKTLDFVAAASSEKLSFVSLIPGWAGAALDHVGIVAVTNAPPEPPVSVNYNLGRDFALVNPNGVWSYGHQSAIGAPFTLMSSHQTVPGGNGLSILLWHTQSAPAIYANTNDTAVTSGGESYPPHTAWCYAGPEGSDRTFAVMRFTVPAGGAGLYRIASAVSPRISNGGDDSDFHVAKNGVELFGQFLSATESGGYTNAVSLQSGDTIDFLVGRGANGRLFGSGLKLQVTINFQTNAPPEPPAGLVANGSFEMGTNPGISTDVSAPNSTAITGWTVEAGSVDYIGSRWTAGDGVRCLDLSGTDAGTISQMISGLTPGQHYRLSFLMAANPEVGSITARLRASIGGASQEFSFQQSGFSTANLGWTEKSLVFTASSASHKLSFTSLNPGWAGAALDRVAMTVSTTPPPPDNHAPAAKAIVGPLFELWDDESTLLVIAGNGVNAELNLDGSMSSDADDDTLEYLWAEEGQASPFATGVLATNSFELGAHTLLLVVDDGLATDTDAVEVEVITLSEAVEELLLFVTELDLTRKEKRQLLATLNRVWDSFDEGRLNAGAKQLGAFQQKVRAHLLKVKPSAGRKLIEAAGQVIDAATAALGDDGDPKKPRDDKKR
jgi:choice-of-anchor C domain-containing protein